MATQETYLLKLSPDKIINESASTYRKYYSLPKTHKFVPEGETSSKQDSNWTILGEGSLSRLTLDDTLLIVAHGSPSEAGGRNVYALLRDLYLWGLHEVGVIVFKCCDIGRGDFLEQFVKRAHATYDMKIGFVKGYRGAAATLSVGSITSPYELISNKNSKGFKVGSKRYKVVPGLNSFFDESSFEPDD